MKSKHLWILAFWWIMSVWAMHIPNSSWMFPIVIQSSIKLSTAIWFQWWIWRKLCCHKCYWTKRVSFWTFLRCREKFHNHFWPCTVHQRYFWVFKLNLCVHVCAYGISVRVIMIRISWNGVDVTKGNQIYMRNCGYNRMVADNIWNGTYQNHIEPIIVWFIFVEFKKAIPWHSNVIVW